MKMLSWLKENKQKTKNPKTTRRQLKPYPICHGKKDKRIAKILKYSNFKKKTSTSNFFLKKNLYIQGITTQMTISKTMEKNTMKVHKLQTNKHKVQHIWNKCSANHTLDVFLHFFPLFLNVTYLHFPMIDRNVIS